MGISGPGKDVLVLIGTQQVDSESIAHLQMYYPVSSTSLLNELRGGDLDGISDDYNAVITVYKSTLTLFSCS